MYSRKFETSCLGTEFIKSLTYIYVVDYLAVLYTPRGIKERNRISRKIYATVYLFLGQPVYLKLIIKLDHCGNRKLDCSTI